ncbi:MAG: N-acetyl sugar amidotransferase [Deltaproteobacteria bacterium]|nr:N-acetyl sugar amidotransferase [Deltaproteobacteria bacterium]
MHLVNTTPAWVETLRARFEKRPKFTRCSRCLYDESTPSITFDDNGVCSYCHMMDQLDAQYPTGKEGWNRLTQIAEQIKLEGRRKKYDVVVGVSGGCDSSYMLHLAKELGLRPLAVHYDNTWNSQIATENIHNVLKVLEVELFTYVVDNEEYNDIFRAFLRAGVPEIDGPTDIALTTTLYMAAAKYGIKYIFNGHSFRTEGVSPLGWCYTDGKYIDSVVRQFSERKLKTFPNLWMSTFLRYMLVSRVKRIRPLYYVDYHKEETKKFLTSEFGWQWYGGHHLENRMTHFNHAFVFPLRFNMDQRLNGYSALVRSGQMTRAEGLELIRKPLKLDMEVLEIVQKRLGFDDAEMERVMTQPLRTFRDFKTYKETFERMRPFFWLMYKLDMVPKSFYIKYTSRNCV